MQIAMWSGPRNLSTAMMYSFASRGDFSVWDEPFYAPYLKSTGLKHPMADEILAAHETNAEQVAEAISKQPPPSQPHTYLKLMTHHMLADFPLDWAQSFVHVHLIRNPVRVIASYSARRENPVLADLGYDQQVEIFDRFGGLVVDSDDVLSNPSATLSRLCSEIGLNFLDSMLRWPAGPRPEDGIWAKHWYGSVHRSTGFSAPDPTLPAVDQKYASLLRDANKSYSYLRRHKL